MGTKLNPGPFDCYANALPDEPMFVLLARDPAAPSAIITWANWRRHAVIAGVAPSGDLEMVDEALRCGIAMIGWRQDNLGQWHQPQVGSRTGSVAPRPSAEAERWASRLDNVGNLEDDDAALLSSVSTYLRATPTPDAAADALAEAVKPWADYHGDLPDFDHPLRCVFESGVQYAVELLAKILKVEEWTPCDGTEEYDGDLGGTMMDIVLEAMPKDEHGDPIWPRDLVAQYRQQQPGVAMADEGVAS